MTIQAQRNEIQLLQHQVSDLLHERSLMKAATASDVRSFCLNYQATMATSSWQSMAPPSSHANTETIPVYEILLFLHRYSNGLVPPPENKRKRWRSSSGSSSAPRLLHRMATRQRCCGEEGEEAVGMSQ